MIIYVSSRTPTKNFSRRPILWFWSPAGIKGATDQIMSWKAPNDPKHSPWVYYITISHFGPLWSLLGTHGGPKRARFGPKRPPRSLEGPGGPDLVPTAPHWPAWVRFMVRIHFDLVSGPFWTPKALKGLVLAPKCPFGGPRGPRRAPKDQILSQLPPNAPPELD